MTVLDEVEKALEDFHLKNKRYQEYAVSNSLKALAASLARIEEKLDNPNVSHR